MDQARAEKFLEELQTVTRIIYTGEVPDLKSSSTLLIKSIKPSGNPFIRKDATGQTLFYIIKGSAGVDIGQPERIIVPCNRSVGEISMIATVINSFDNLMTVESRTADVYAEEQLQLIVFNYAPLVDIINNNNPELVKLRGQVMISLNRIMFKKLMEVNQNYIDILVGYGLNQEAEETGYPKQLVESLGAFLKLMKSIPFLRISPHDLRGVLIREKEANSSIIFIEEGKIMVSAMVKDEDTDETERFDLDIMSAPVIIGESSILNQGSISNIQIEALENVRGYKITVQNLLRNIQRYQGLSE